MACTLDRNPRGMGILSQRWYFCAMEDLFAKCPSHCELVEGSVRKKGVLAALNRGDGCLRPAMVPAAKPRGGRIEENDLGMEYELAIKAEVASAVHGPLHRKSAH